MQSIAEESGLVATIGQDAVQAILAEAFKDRLAWSEAAKEYHRDRDKPHTDSNGRGPARNEPLERLPWLDMSRWDNELVRQQEWTVLDRVPRRQCVLLSGEGAAGKSTLQLHLSAAHVLARDWLGTMPEPGPAIYIDAEDDEKVLHRRLAGIANHYQVAFQDLIKGGLHLMALAGRDAVLAEANRNGKIAPTQLYRQLLEAAGDISR